MLYTAFIFGLFSSLHCVAMCGPIALMLPVDRTNHTKMVTQILTYHLGRLTSYSTMGLIFGLLGRGFFMAGFQQKVSIFIGVAIIVAVVIPEKLFAQFNFSKPIYRILSKVKTALGNQFKKKTFSSLFIIGLLNGFLPCSMVYVALFGAVAMQNALVGSFYMLLFGLGTIPLMSAAVYSRSFLPVLVRYKIQKVIPFVAVIIGILFIFRGLGLGIPYVSPPGTSLFIQQIPNCH